MDGVIFVSLENKGKDRAVFEAALSETTKGIGVSIGPSEMTQMYAHYQEVIEANQQFNLTRITGPADAAVKHYADSLTLLAASWFDTDEAISMLDVGTGAGFPAVPLAIACPNWTITAIDGTGKKTRFLAEAAAHLGLSNIRARHARAADLARAGREQFDAVLLRAVAKLAPGLAQVGPLVKPGGCVLFYKTPRIGAGELAEGARTARRLGFQEAGTFDISLPSPEGLLARRLVRYTKCPITRAR